MDMDEVITLLGEINLAIDTVMSEEDVDLVTESIQSIIVSLKELN